LTCIIGVGIGLLLALLWWLHRVLRRWDESASDDD
jgi:hypothetical protein